MLQAPDGPCTDPEFETPAIGEARISPRLCFGIDRKWIVDKISLGRQRDAKASKPSAARSPPAHRSTTRSATATTTRSRPARSSHASPRSWRPSPGPTFKIQLARTRPRPTSTDIPAVDSRASQRSDRTRRLPNDSSTVERAKTFPVKLREFTADELPAGKVEYDLRYAEITVGEPLTDARTLIGPTGLAGDVQSPYLDAALRDLDAATNWKDVRARLAKLHEIANHELPVIPLWQTINYFAYRTSVRGIDESPIALYQNIGQWTLAPATQMSPAPTRPSRNAATMSHTHHDISTSVHQQRTPPQRLRFSYFATLAILIASISPYQTPKPKTAAGTSSPTTSKSTSRSTPPAASPNNSPATALATYNAALKPPSPPPGHAMFTLQPARTAPRFSQQSQLSTHRHQIFPQDKDKLFLAAVRTGPDGIELTAREFDRYVQRWSPPLRRESRQESYLPEQLFSLIHQTFSPLAQLELDPKDPRRVVLKPRGTSLPRSAGAVPLAKARRRFCPGPSPHHAQGELEKKDGLQTVPWTYIEATEVKDNTIVGRFHSASRRPIIVRRQGRIEPVAIAMHTDPRYSYSCVSTRAPPPTSRSSATKCSHKSPATRHSHAVGLTNTAGQITIPPGKTPLQFLLVKHGGQLFAKIPVVAGEKQRHRHSAAR